MKMIFRHVGFNGRNGIASAVIPGPKPASNLDWPSTFSIDASFYITAKDSDSGLGASAHISAGIPNSKNLVHINFIVEQEVRGSDRADHGWPASGEYRTAFAKMLAGVLSHAEVDLSA
jgi:hypothetical protein